MSTTSLQASNDSTKMKAEDSKLKSLMRSKKFLLALFLFMAIVIICIGIAIWQILDSKEKEELIPVMPVAELNPPKNYTKLLVMGGRTKDDFLKSTEVLDLADSSLKCAPLPDYPLDISYLTGDLINDTTLLFCGGWDGSIGQAFSECFFMQSKGTYQAPSLPYQLYLADSVAINGSLYVTGGAERGNQSELIHSVSSENGPDLLGEEQAHCMIRLDETDLLLISPTRRSAFFNISANEWREGPSMQFTGNKLKLSAFGCGLMYFNGGLVAVASGRGPDHTFTEMMDLKAPMGYLRWEVGPKLPKKLYDFKMVSFDKTLVIVGGDLDDEASAKLLILRCPDTIVYNCIWKEMKHELSIGRYGHEAIMIPDEMTTCTYPI